MGIDTIEIMMITMMALIIALAICVVTIRVIKMEDNIGFEVTQTMEETIHREIINFRGS